MDPHNCLFRSLNALQYANGSSETTRILRDPAISVNEMLLFSAKRPVAGVLFIQVFPFQHSFLRREQGEYRIMSGSGVGIDLGYELRL